jgi:hypothetical protein
MIILKIKNGMNMMMIMKMKSKQIQKIIKMKIKKIIFKILLLISKLKKDMFLKNLNMEKSKFFIFKLFNFYFIFIEIMIMDILIKNHMKKKEKKEDIIKNQINIIIVIFYQKLLQIKTLIINTMVIL